jgi:simple sugar transport system ATP-binding protein
MGDTQTPVVEMKGITKRFLDVTANDAIDFALYRGEICALLGENGAGKTTLMNILFGYYGYDEGEIYIKGERAQLLAPRDAISYGIGMVHQHFTLVPTQTVLENIIIGTNTGKGLFIDEKGAKRRLEELMQRFGLRLDPDALVWTLSVGQQQRIEILKALYREVDILIMDEPTAVLGLAETRELFQTLKILASEGKSVIFISHKLNEVMEIADRVVVLRGGEVIAERNVADTDTKELANLMVGRELLERVEKTEMEPGEPVLEISDMQVRNDNGLEAVLGVSFQVHRREILGLAGVSGNGQTELSEVLFGVRPYEAGTVKVEGHALKAGEPLEAIRAGMGRIPEDRISTGLLMDLSVEENLILENHGSPEYLKHGLLDFEKIHRYSDEAIRLFSIKTDGRDAEVKSLSGGNLQKIILARELAGEPKVIVACQPTRGLDVGAMEYVHSRLLEAREKDVGILLISEDLDEVFLLSDRIIVFYEGEIIGEAYTKEASREQIGLWMSGVRE